MDAKHTVTCTITVRWYVCFVNFSTTEFHCNVRKKIGQMSILTRNQLSEWYMVFIKIGFLLRHKRHGLSNTNNFRDCIASRNKQELCPLTHPGVRGPRASAMRTIPRSFCFECLSTIIFITYRVICFSTGSVVRHILTYPSPRDVGNVRQE